MPNVRVMGGHSKRDRRKLAKAICQELVSRHIDAEVNDTPREWRELRGHGFETNEWVTMASGIWVHNMRIRRSLDKRSDSRGVLVSVDAFHWPATRYHYLAARDIRKVADVYSDLDLLVDENGYKDAITDKFQGTTLVCGTDAKFATDVIVKLFLSVI